MRDNDKTREQLIEELKTLRRRIVEFEKLAVERKQAEEELKKYRKHLEELVKERTAELETMNEELQQEILKRKKTELYLRETRQYAESIVQTVREPLVVLDDDLQVISANRAFYQTFQVAPEDTVGEFIYDLGDRHWDIPRLRELLQEIIRKSTELRDFEVDHEFPTIGRRTVVLNARLIHRGANETPMILLTIEDITERKQMEERLLASERLAALGQLSGSISHELRNPLATVDSSAYYLKRKLKDADRKVQEHLDRIKSGVVRAKGIIESLLDLTRTREPRLQRHDLVAIISDAIASSRVPATVNVTQDHREEPVLVNADREQLRVAFQNIVNNAVEAMDGKGMLTATVRKTVAGRAEVSFADTGPGIAPENLVRIFEPLFSTKATGIGLGLSIVKMIVDKHRGAIEAKSEPEEGATIVICLPLYVEKGKDV